MLVVLLGIQTDGRRPLRTGDGSDHHSVRVTLQVLEEPHITRGWLDVGRLFIGAASLACAGDTLLLGRNVVAGDAELEAAERGHLSKRRLDLIVGGVEDVPVEG